MASARRAVSHAAAPDKQTVKLGTFIIKIMCYIIDLADASSKKASTAKTDVCINLPL